MPVALPVMTTGAHHPQGQVTMMQDVLFADPSWSASWEQHSSEPSPRPEETVAKAMGAPAKVSASRMASRMEEARGVEQLVEDIFGSLCMEAPGTFVEKISRSKEQG